jgi:ABC-type transport system involved in cytochrome c biogenesis ATPase subunit
VDNLQGLVGEHLNRGGAVMLTTHQEVGIAASGGRLDLSA